MTEAIFVTVVIACFVVTCRASCQFPVHWAGQWFQSGVQHFIHIEGNVLSYRGTCISMEGDKFLLEDKKENCFRCIVVHEKHFNVLQYKETYCEPRDTLENLCSNINGDAQLFTMFRVNATPQPCPFYGPFTFTYNRGHGECKYPVSSVDSCNEDWRLLFRYQACPDVAGTESIAEELVCLATWKEGSLRFLVGRLEHKMAQSSEDKFRCFSYEELEDETGYQVAQSGDATCIGLFSPVEGSRIMKLTRASPPSSTCEFPNWVTGATSWHTLDRRKNYLFDLSTNASFSVSRPDAVTPEMEVTCVETRAINERRMIVVLHATVGCRNGYVCATIYRRKDHVIELQQGMLVRHFEDACIRPHYDEEWTEFVTLVTASPRVGSCPQLGKYNVLEGNGLSRAVGLPGTNRKETRDLCIGFTEIHVGCGRDDIIEFHSSCPAHQEPITYQCHGNWQENGTHYLITSREGSKTRYCFIYAEVDNVMKFSSVHESCNRRVQLGINGVMAFNITSEGECSDTSGGASLISSSSSLLLVMWADAILLLVVVVLT